MTLEDTRRIVQMLSSVSPGLELHQTMVGLLRSIFSGSRAVEAKDGFLRLMHRLTGVTAAQCL